MVRGTVAVSGEASPQGTISIAVDGTEVGTVQGGTFSFDLDTLSLSEGQHVVSATLASASGSASDSATVTVDNCPPWAGPGYKKPPRSCRGR